MTDEQVFFELRNQDIAGVVLEHDIFEFDYRQSDGGVVVMMTGVMFVNILSLLPMIRICSPSDLKGEVLRYDQPMISNMKIIGSTTDNSELL